jgi:aryl-alcohol dehydrogenase-like predicted oxidoreductase
MALEEVKTRLVLGTAGWQVASSVDQAFAIFNRFCDRGGLWIDTSTNYPIDNRYEFGSTMELLSKWCRSKPEIRIVAKFGAMRNDGSSDSNLTPDYVRFVLDRLVDKLGDALGVVGVHFDNRRDPNEVQATVDELIRFHEASGCGLGFSGVVSPDLYRDACTGRFSRWVIQVPARAGSQEVVEQLRGCFPEATILSYGALGGLERRREPGAAREVGVSPVEVGPNHLTRTEILSALNCAVARTQCDGVIVAPRTLSQLEDYVDLVEADESKYAF